MRVPVWRQVNDDGGGHDNGHDGWCCFEGGGWGRSMHLGLGKAIM